MKNNSVKEFENKRWSRADQALVFRHTKAIEMVKQGQKVLDIACGDGLLLSELAKKGAETYGIDISEDGARKCIAKGLNVSVVDIAVEKIPFKEETFDTVIMLDILEHMYAPEDLLKEAIRVSKKYIIISVPNFSSLPARLQVLFGNVPENNRPNKGHIFWFTYNNLMNMLNKNKLQVDCFATNTFLQNKFLVGRIISFLAKIFPSLFALSFVVRLKK